MLDRNMTIIMVRVLAFMFCLDSLVTQCIFSFGRFSFYVSHFETHFGLDYRGPPTGRYSPPPHGYRAYSPPRQRGPVNPYDMDYPATFRQFTEWYRYNHPGQVEADPNAKNPDGTPVNPYKKPYDEYRRAFTSEQVWLRNSCRGRTEA